MSARDSRVSICRASFVPNSRPVVSASASNAVSLPRSVRRALYESTRSSTASTSDASVCVTVTVTGVSLAALTVDVDAADGAGELAVRRAEQHAGAGRAEVAVEQQGVLRLG